MPETITLLHGFTQRGAAWDELAALLPAGVGVLAPDLRGHGANVAGPCDMASCLRDLERLWASEGIARTHLAGYSMGGRLALHVAAHRPDLVLSLTVVGAHAGLDAPEREARRRADADLAERIEDRGMEWFAGHWEALEMFASLRRRRPDLAGRMRAMRMANDPRGLACSLRGMGAGAMEPVWDRLGALRAPALFLAGDEDSRYGAFIPRLVAAVADGRGELVPRAGHAAHLENPRAVAGLLASQLG